MEPRMSEYQYYEFHAIDRPLAEKEQGELRAYSTRARITATSFSNEYSWGNFKGNPDAWMEKYFDAFLYLANWGTRKIKLRMPSSLLSLETVKAYCHADSARAREKNGKIILDFISDEETGGQWEEGESWLSSIIAVRTELAGGDYRCLYLAWLLCAQNSELDEEEEEPDVPNGLGELSGSLSSFADFLRIDNDLLHVAAERSLPLGMPLPNHEEILNWVQTLSPGEKDGFLVRLVSEEGVYLRTEMFRRFLKEKQKVVSFGPKPRKRTVAELLSKAGEYREERKKAEVEKATKEKTRREAEEAARRNKYLDALARREPETWLKVNRLIATKQPSPYNEAIKLLVDLRDLATRKGKGGKFNSKFTWLREQHAKKPSLIERMRKAGL